MERNLLTLERFRKLAMYNPFHFWQIAGNVAQVSNTCDPIVFEYPYQAHNAASRQDVFGAIAEAEQVLARELGFWPGPQYITEQINVGCCLHFPKFVSLGWGLVQSIGTLAFNKLGTTGLLSYTDSDGDGVDDFFTATYLDNTTDVTTLVAAFQTSDITPEQAIEGPKILEPVWIDRLDPNTIRVRGHRWQVVKPVVYEGLGAAGTGGNYNEFGVDSSGAIAPSDNTKFVTNLDLYQKVVTGAGQVTIVSNTTNQAPQTFTYNAALCNTRLGVLELSPASGLGSDCWYNPGCTCNQITQQTLTVNYTAGAKLSDWETIIMKLAIARLDRWICGCEDFTFIYNQYRINLAESGGINEPQFRVDPKILANPLGTRQGEVDAWRNVIKYRIVKAVATARNSQFVKQPYDSYMRYNYYG